MVLQLIERLGPVLPVCCEIGARDGLDLSNTAALWRDEGWRAVLCEADPKHATALLTNVQDHHCDVLITPATPSNINDIVPKDCSVLSIDIDGDEYWLLDALEVWPSVVIVEYNPTIPFWVHVVGEPGQAYGASVIALITLARSKDSFLVGATPCNLIFTKEEHLARSFDTDLETVIGRRDLTYLTTDYNGHPLPIGPLCFGLATPDHDHPYPTVVRHDS